MRLSVIDGRALSVIIAFVWDGLLQPGGVDLMGLKPNPLDLSSSGALTLLVGSFDL